MGRASGLAMTHGHRDFTVCSCSSLPVLSRVGEHRNARSPRLGPVYRRCATLDRRPAAATLPRGNAHRGAARHPGPGVSLLYQRRRPFGRSPSTRPPLGAVRRPTLASGSRCTFAPAWCVRQRPDSRAGSHISLRHRWAAQNQVPAHGWRPRTTQVASGVSGAAASLRMSIRQPVSRAANRAFWPSLPIASDSWKSGTVTRAARAAASTT